jgi:hypothetical protein
MKNPLRSNILEAPLYGIYIFSVDTIFRSLWFISLFARYMVASNNNATKPMVLVTKLK